MRIKNIITHAPHLGPKEQNQSNLDEVIRVSGPTINEPSISEMASSFVSATARWVSAGLPVIDKNGYDKRMSICNACEFWDAHARLGLGKCRASGCGCTKFKQWLSTEKCPKGKW